MQRNVPYILGASSSSYQAPLSTWEIGIEAGGTWGPLDEVALQQYLDREVRVPQEEMRGTVDWVAEAVTEVLQWVAGKDRRFSSDLVRSGSYSEHLKVDLADEFDFMVPLSDTEELEVEPPDWEGAEENAVDVRCAAGSPWDRAKKRSLPVTYHDSNLGVSSSWDYDEPMHGADQDFFFPGTYCDSHLEASSPWDYAVPKHQTYLVLQQLFTPLDKGHQPKPAALQEHQSQPQRMSCWPLSMSRMMKRKMRRRTGRHHGSWNRYIPVMSGGNHVGFTKENDFPPTYPSYQNRPMPMLHVGKRVRIIPKNCFQPTYPSYQNRPMSVLHGGNHMRITPKNCFQPTYPPYQIRPIPVMSHYNHVGFTTSNDFLPIGPAYQSDRFEPPSETVSLDPRKLMQLFQKRVKSACEHSQSSDIVIKLCQLKPDSPAVTLTLLKGEQTVTADLVPIIANPFSSDQVKWPHRWTGEGWPSREKITAIHGCGVDVVAKKRWRISFSRAERVLMTAIDADRGHRRNSLKILKKVYQDKWKCKKVLSSYHLKTVLFWACEEFPESEDWEDLMDSFKRLVNVLGFFLHKKCLPLYFLPSVNLLAEKQDRLGVILEQVSKLQDNPMRYMKLKKYLRRSR